MESVSDTKNLELVRFGNYFLGMLNDLKRRPEDAANELNVSLEEITGIIEGKKEITSKIISRAVKIWPVNYRDFFLIHDDCPDGIKIMRNEDSAKSSRVMDRGGMPYYEYRDTAMSSVALFRPEWIEELCIVEDNDPNNLAVQWNNGHFMHQFTYFIGDVNYYYRGPDGEKKVAQPLASGDNKEPKEGQEIIAEKDTEEVKEISKEDMIKAMKDMPEEIIKAAFDKMNKESKDEEVSDEDKGKEALQKEAVEQRIKEIDVTEHVEALMSGEGDLTDDFKKKAATVFESAVKSKVRNEVTRLQENYDKELEEATKSIKSELSEKVDTYLNYVVEEWMKDNQLAVERGLKGEIAEDFIAGLKQLFEDHYVDIPDEKYDVLQAQSDKIAELEEKVNKTLDESMELKKSKDSLTRNKVMSESTSDLADTEIEKFKELTQDVDFDNEDNFKGKLDTLKESYFPKVKKESSETIDNVATGPAQDIDMSDSMAAYTKAISHAEAENVKGATK